MESFVTERGRYDIRWRYSDLKAHLQICRLETVWGTGAEDRPSEVHVSIGRLEDTADHPDDLEQILKRHRNDRFMIALNRAQLNRKPLTRPSLLISFKYPFPAAPLCSNGC